MAGAVKCGLSLPVLDQGEIVLLAGLGEFLLGFVEAIHVSKVVLIVVKTHGLGVNVRLEGFVVVRKGG
jgi:hypothetical protein